MKIIATSDLHGYMPKVPPCDILILAGDYLAEGEDYEIEIFREWLEGAPARHVVGVAGNHCRFLEDRARGTLAPLRWHYLQDSGIEIEGIKIYGSPWTPPFYDWAFMRSEDLLKETFAKIPENLDILITHGPPLGIRDKNRQGLHCGSKALMNAYRALEDNGTEPKAHIFGHIHEGYGENGNGFYNVSRCDERYRPINPLMEIVL